MSPELVAALVGLALPAVVSVVVRSHWPAWAKGVTAAGTSLVAGTLTAAASGAFTGATIAGCFGAALAASQIAYATWWQPTGIGPAIERATQPDPNDPDVD